MTEESTQSWGNTEDATPNDEDADAKMMQDQELLGSDSQDPRREESTQSLPNTEDAAPNNEDADAPNDEDVAPTKHYGCSKCRWHYGGCSQCKRWADANRHGYVRDNLGNPHWTS